MSDDQYQDQAESTVSTESASISEAPKQSTASDRVEDLVEQWHNDMFPGSIVARSTETWNHVMHCKEELKKRLRDFVQKLN